MEQGPKEIGLSIPGAALNLTGQGPGLPVLSVFCFYQVFGPDNLLTSLVISMYFHVLWKKI